MTDPLTPREKVEQTPMHLDAAKPAAANPLSAALASGSGDHAELARLADDLRKFEHHSVGSLKISMDEVRRIIAVCDAHAALLTENAALRAERDGMVEEVSRSQARLHAATEAERKLAEAVGLLRRIDRIYADMQDGNGNHPTELRKVRTFLSKEAERG